MARPDLAGSRVHTLVETVHCAFSSHYPLTLSPDAIWLVIAQGFGHHVNAHAETLRPRLVRHQGQRSLQEKISALTITEFERAVAGFSAQICAATDPVLYETLLCDFSTTTPDIRTASHIAIMDSYSNYFKYHLMCVCGIPRITLKGSPEDWERIRARVEVLDTYDLSWWVSRLRPILDEFVMAASGTANQEFWKAIYKPQDVYGGHVVTGWLVDLFPYVGDTPPRRPNPVLNQPRENWGVPVANGLKPSSFPSGLSSVPVEVQFPNSSKQDLDLVAGFLAMEQDPKSLSLSPLIGWSVTAPVPEKPVWTFSD